MSNIDRCFANIVWLSEYPNVIVERVEKGISDHCPQLLRFDSRETKKGLFKFYNVLADHEKFEPIVREEWKNCRSTILLRNIWLKCQELNRSFKQLNTQWYVKTSEKVASLRQALQMTQNSLQRGSDRELIQEEQRLITKLEKWSNIAEKIWQQKSRVDWIQLGDSNTMFFYAYAKVRQNSNAIHRLIKADGPVCLGQEMIK